MVALLGLSMKFNVLFKTPDAVEYSTDHLSLEEKVEAMETARKFVQYGEYITIEFDTETKTATVLPAR